MYSAPDGRAVPFGYVAAQPTQRAGRAPEARAAAVHSDKTKKVRRLGPTDLTSRVPIAWGEGESDRNGDFKATMLSARRTAYYTLVIYVSCVAIRYD
jgi:hypothetical protein